MKVFICILSEHNKWANDRLLSDCSKLTEHDYHHNHQPMLGSVHETLVSGMATDGHWLSRFSGEPMNSFFAFGSPATCLDDLQEKRSSLDEALCNFAHSLTESRLSKTIALQDPDASADFHQPLCMAMLHMFQQQTQYRSQVQVLLSQAGLTVSGTDLHLFQNLTGRGTLRVHKTKKAAI
ncbi:DinB family protein [Roseibium suaedae]|uniref:Uncharacterized damage-inducible protein DinB (Forms a four-helix bundle) n=1 Tax=Roseibium suaedae TaxID=735517 RepID=A0A1M7LBD7_9HYPH|nr:DinB family protein [Roseibium suaedae]SHM75134.1 Uncharacterized damage-inducible protein DinB (forms a four-helix bundle) [Roseibium suaedae]